MLNPRLEVSLQEVTRANWRDALALGVHPAQQRFVADVEPPAAIALAKAYVRPSGIPVVPFGIYAGIAMVGFLVLAYEPGSEENYWLSHFFVDRRYQGQGYGGRALETLARKLEAEHPSCRALQLTVHAENQRARRLYEKVGFTELRALSDGEHVYRLRLGT
ncbi:MAG: GNAT family N-acetyltransferase [Myxococcaceae bacterium]|nr:GNAT family N-acetyltransferase [Myxococcaceae bacterium]MCI0672449.1 GNAT family N-acetyltransferase [Myxococcaceae bacterium]